MGFNIMSSAGVTFTPTEAIEIQMHFGRQILQITALVTNSVSGPDIIISYDSLKDIGGIVNT